MRKKYVVRLTSEERSEELERQQLVESGFAESNQESGAMPVVDMDDSPYDDYEFGEDGAETDEYLEETEDSLSAISTIRSREPIDSPFVIERDLIYYPPHFSPRIRSQDGVLMACCKPMKSLDESEYIEIIIKNSAHKEIRKRLEKYGVSDKQLFPDLDGMAQWLKYKVFEINE